MTDCLPPKQRKGWPPVKSVSASAAQTPGDAWLITTLTERENQSGARPEPVREPPTDEEGVAAPEDRRLHDFGDGSGLDDERRLSRGQAAERRDRAAVLREEAAADRDVAQAGADEGATSRDDAAVDREQAASDREQTASARDDLEAVIDEQTSGRDHAAAGREQAASDRDQTAADPEAKADGRTRHRARSGREGERPVKDPGRSESDSDERARNRGQGADDRAQATADRSASAADRDQSEVDAHERTQHRGQVADDRVRASADRDDAAADRLHSQIDADGRSAYRRLAAADRESAESDRHEAATDRADATRDYEQARADLRDAQVDQLTGAFGRKLGLVMLARDIDRARRDGVDFVLAYVDVDGLKSVNDARGHAAGDALLHDVVAAIGRHLRSYDGIARVGGDEFLCSLAGCTPEIARRRFHTVREMLRQFHPAASFSVGFAALGPNDTLEELQQRADKDLYEAKHNR
jgi:diguanylate cyclase (GGDEF)-like protein